MAKSAVVVTGGKQYLVKENDEIIVDTFPTDGKDSVQLSVLAVFDDEKAELELGTPLLKTTVKATIVEEVKGDKIRVARFKAKVRYRRVTGHRSQLIRLKVGAI
jgi:large subunit ribosomal protein L21